MSKMKNSNLLLVYISRFISSLGDQFYTLALSTTLYSLTGSALAATGYLAIKGIVYILGLFIYRSPQPGVIKKIVIFGDLGRGILTLLLLLLLKLNFYFIYVIVFLMEIIQLYYSPARVVLIHNISKEKNLSHKIDQIISTLSVTLGLSIGGFVTYYFGGFISIFINSLSFFFCALIAVFIKYNSQETQLDEKKTFPLRWLWHKTPLQKKYITLFSTFSFPAFAFNSLIIVYIFQVLNEDSRFYGIVESIMALGLLIGSIISIRKGGQLLTRVRTNAIYLLLMGILYVFSLAYDNNVWFSTLLFFSAVANMLFSSYYRATMSEIFSNSHDLANAWTINRSIVNLSGSIGILFFSFISDLLNVEISMYISGFCLIVLGGFLFLSFGYTYVLNKEIES